ncbi:hypothetical protein [Oceanobacillus salinisoli]|nr:hypothetical protein [Oceanobacillus salinisoli]
MKFNGLSIADGDTFAMSLVNKDKKRGILNIAIKIKDQHKEEV